MISIYLQLSQFVPGVIPDYEVGDMLINALGNRAHPTVRFWRMMYWMPKFKNLSPWLLPKPVPDDAYELALLAVKQMCTVDLASTVVTWQTSDVKSAIDDTWIVSGQSEEQQGLLRQHPEGMAVQVCVCARPGRVCVLCRCAALHVAAIRRLSDLSWRQPLVQFNDKFIRG